MGSQKNSEDTNFLERYFSRIRRLKKKVFLSRFFLNLLSSLFYGISLSFLGFLIYPEESGSFLFLGFGTFLFLFFFSNRWRAQKVEEHSILLSLDIKNPSSKCDLYNRDLWNSEDFWEEWNGPAEILYKDIEKREKKKLLRKFCFFVPSLIMASLLWFFHGTDYLESSQDFFSSFVEEKGQIKILQGARDPKHFKFQSLSADQKINIKLSKTNLVEILFSPRKTTQIPYLFLKNKEHSKSRSQSFQMHPQKTNAGSFQIQFSVGKSSELFLPLISEEALVNFDIEEGDSPRLTLSSKQNLEEALQDDRTLNLDISAFSKYGIRDVYLNIHVKENHFRELVYSSGSVKKKSYKTSHPIYLEKYMESDYEIFEILAEGVDHSVPIPLTGFSDPLVVNVISSYGKYREILSKLRAVKLSVDQAKSDGEPQLKKDIPGLVRKAEKDAIKSPFFDGRDRQVLKSLKSILSKNRKESNLELIYSASQILDNFLHQHEMLDDRERDRDFYIAARGLSHLLENNSEALDLAEKKILDFLREREKRWKMRISRLRNPEKVESRKKIVEEKFFSINFDKKILRNTPYNAENNKKSQTALTQLVASYKNWLDELEAAEDEEMQEEEKMRTEQLMSAREELKKLQKRQLDISKKVHGSDTKDPEELEKEWPITRMHQNSNIEDAKKLEALLNILTPNSSERLNAAIEAMKFTVESGEAGEYSHAESFADLATRLLHQASKMAQQEQGRRSRAYRRGSDQYYGHSIIGGDVEIKHEYRVDPKYREEVLDEVVDSDYEGENRRVLNNFLKKIIR